MSSKPFRWDARSGRYINPSGRFVSRREVQLVMDQTVKREVRNARDLATALRNGDISLVAYRDTMRDVIRNVHLYSAAAAKGGWAQLTQSDYGRIGNVIKSEFKYLDRLTQQVQDGLPLDGRLTQRTIMYAEAGRSTYTTFEREAQQRAGYRFEANNLSGTEHCAGCLIEANRGRVPIGALVLIGNRDCGRHCRCWISYHKDQG